MKNPRLFAVAGDPILHSKSPDMFQAAFRACSLDALYLRFASSGAKDIVQTARDMGIAGFNITSPCKEAIVPFLDDMEGAARTLGAVNTIVFKNGRLTGFNTDVDGVTEAFQAHGIAVGGKKALVLGAGGAAKAAAFALLLEGAEVTFVNRTLEKAKEIARVLSCKAATIETVTREMEDTDILISCISEEADIIPRNSLTKDLVLLDARYRKETPLVREARAKGCTIIDGKEWLLFQGTHAFSHFTGQDAPVAAMREALYNDRAFTKRNIALVGFMGTGKSTVGRYLAENLNMSFVDIDNEIEQKSGASIEDIFRQQGEEVFRRMEEKEINATVDMSGRIISLGGGAVLNKASMDRLKEHALIVWLHAGLKTILQRIGHGRSRPLLNVHDRRSEAEQMLRLRKEYYAYASDLFINTDEKEPREIAQRIYDESNKFLEG